MEGAQIATYVLGLFFVIAFVAKMSKYGRMPAHLRWELYPLAGETNRPWGGSYLEESEWWAKPREEKSLLGELKFMGQEILFFKEYFHRNRGLWYVVFPFHIGVFLLVTFVALLVIGAITMTTEIAISSGSSNVWGQIVYYATLVAGIAALVLGTLGCLGLFIKKVVDPNMSPYTRRIEYINILFILAIFVTGVFAWSLADSNFATARAFTKGLITFSDPGSIDAIITAHIVLLMLFLAYMPFTNIMHFFAKHFTYNSVRWDDSPHLRGSEVELKIQPLLQQPMAWAAPHIAGEGIKHWRDIPENVSLKNKKEQEQ